VPFWGRVIPKILRAILVVSLLPGLLLIVGGGYQAYWVHGAKRAVTTAADALVKGETVPDLALNGDSAIAQELARGYRVTGYDNIGFGFRAYEVMVRVASGDQYNFVAIHDNGRWQLSCCGRHPRDTLVQGD